MAHHREFKFQNFGGRLRNREWTKDETEKRVVCLGNRAEMRLEMEGGVLIKRDYKGHNGKI